MKKSELKELIKPIVKECVQESIQETRILQQTGSALCGVCEKTGIEKISISFSQHPVHE